LSHIRNRKPFLPILIMSGRGTVADQVKGLEMGASDYLTKPFEFRELSARVRSLLRRYPGSPDTVLDTGEYRRSFEQVKPLLGLPPTFGFTVVASGPCPKGHSQAVSWLAMQIAKRLGLSRVKLEEIRLAGLLHDIGKIQLPLNLIDKAAPLTAEELETVRSHAVLGERMLGPLNIGAIALVVRHHHERYDGTGYPDGLFGEEIPLEARILAVAEAFEDMLAELPYKSARSFEQAVAELRRCSGTQFDPEVAMAFLTWLEIVGDPREQTGTV